MITLYTWTTSNGCKASIMLEEIGAQYRVQPINIHRGQQHEPTYLKTGFKPVAIRGRISDAA